MMPTSTDGVTGSTPETVLCKSLIHSYQIGKFGPNPSGGLLCISFFEYDYSLQRQPSLSNNNFDAFLLVREDGQVFLKLQNQWIMIDLSEPTLHKYRRKVLEIYRELERNPWAPLGIFESKLRKINILNSKIKNVSSDIGKPEGEYSNFTNDNYMQYGFKKKNSSQEDTYKEDSLG